MNLDRFTIQLPASFITAGQFIAHQGWVHQPRTLDSYVLYLVERGRFALKVGEARLELQPHDMVILPPDCPHVGEPLETAQSPVYYWAHFIPSETKYKNQIISVKLHGACADYSKSVVTFHQLIHESSDIAPNAMSCDYLMSLLLIQHAEEENKDNLPTALFLRVMEYLRLNYRHNVTLDELSRQFNYSAGYISRQFWDNTGMSVSAYLHSLRLKEAKRLLFTTMDTVRQIGFACGYTNEKYFITVFKSREGMTPSQFRNRFGILHQNNH